MILAVSGSLLEKSGPINKFRNMRWNGWYSHFHKKSNYVILVVSGSWLEKSGPINKFSNMRWVGWYPHIHKKSYCVILPVSGSLPRVPDFSGSPSLPMRADYVIPAVSGSCRKWPEM